jgi:PIN domain
MPSTYGPGAPPNPSLQPPCYGRFRQPSQAAELNREDDPKRTIKTARHEKRRLVADFREYPDAWIAATALYHDVPLVTNDKGFARTRGLRLITLSPEERAAHAGLPVSMRPTPSLDMRCQCGL